MEQRFQDWLDAWIETNHGTAGTLHLREGEDLRLAAARNIPPPVIKAVELVPRGRGMAGLALERNSPVQTCNLKEDRTGDVRPGARAVDAKAAVALPVHDPSGAVVAVAGIAFDHERELGPDELERLTAGFATLPLH